MNLKPLDYKILSELMKNAKSSDRQIAKKLRVSQPTVTRRRAKLEKELSIHYTAIPDWSKLGYRILALTFAKWKYREHPEERLAEAREWLSHQPSLLFMAIGQSPIADRVGLSIHRTYRDYSRSVEEARQTWGNYLEDIHSFIISIDKENILRPLTLKHIADSLKETENIKV